MINCGSYPVPRWPIAAAADAYRASFAALKLRIVADTCFKMPVSGKLVLKGGQTLVSKDIKKKKKSKKKRETAALVASSDQDNPASKEAVAGEPSQQAQQGKQGEAYEKEFKFETERADSAKPRSTAWGVSYRKPPDILHGYNAPVKGDTQEERLDLRCAKKADRMCK